MVCGDYNPEEGPAVSGGRHNISPSARAVETVCLAPVGAQFLEAVLSVEVVEIILSSRAPLMRRLYGLKWNDFGVENVVCNQLTAQWLQC